MEILQSTAKLQQSQTNVHKASQPQEAQRLQETQKTQPSPENIVKNDRVQQSAALSTKEDMEALIEKLNASLDPFNTALRFGFDDSFYVSVIDTQRNEVLRRFPREQAEQLLPKMREVTGLLFDHKG